MTSLHPLARGVEHPSPLRDEASAWLVLAGLFAAPIAWSIQLLVTYGFNGDAFCAAEAQETPLSSKGMIIMIIGIVAIAACVFGFWAAHRTWSLTRKEKPGDHHVGLSVGTGRTRFLGLSGIVASVVFLLASIFELLVPFLESPCVLHLR